MKKHIKDLPRRVWREIKTSVTFPFRKLKTFHERLKQVDEESLDEARKRNPYQMLLEWSLDTVQYGLLATIVVNAFMGWFGTLTNITMVFGIGIARWLVLDFVKEFRQATR